ncbi:5'-nucleotidase, lipoprotein e(P4) family [Pedobacter sp. SAFR-022]|uniref:5'-nucleotidase, lipoprotein e(P4) family n=1 Tax=Pedobacter sp. SAFR-022 TaxID=3436861 RepID=UPI003F81169A
MKTRLAILIAFLMPLGLLAQDNSTNQIDTTSNNQSGYRDYTAAVLWQQHAGEYRALAFQAYNFAKISLLERLKQAGKDKKYCVVVDVDETVLDNSPLQGYEITQGRTFDPKDWSDWTGKGIADTVPGALSFLKFAAEHQVETFYVTNRDTSEMKGTLYNLKTLGFPNADKAHILLKSSTSDKEPRRQQILENYHILLLCGDNLSDFSNIFYRSGKNTIEQVNAAQAEFGTHFIVLPNPMYGDWEKQFYKEGKPTEAIKAAERLKGLKTY